MRKLTTSSAGGDVRKALKSFGLGTSKAGGTVVVKVRDGKVEGSAWKLLGGAGKARVKVCDLLGPSQENDQWVMELNMKDISVFDFQGVAGNVSKWKDGRSLVSSLKKGKEPRIEDRTEIEKTLDAMGLSFVIRLNVLAIGGNKLAVSLGAAPVSMEEMKEACVGHGCSTEASRIPVKEIRSPYNSTMNVKQLDYWPYEAAWVEGPRGWLLFPLIELEVCQEQNKETINLLPLSWRVLVEELEPYLVVRQ